MEKRIRVFSDFGPDGRRIRDAPPCATGSIHRSESTPGQRRARVSGPAVRRRKRDPVFHRNFLHCVALREYDVTLVLGAHEEAAREGGNNVPRRAVGRSGRCDRKGIKSVRFWVTCTSPYPLSAGVNRHSGTERV